MNPFIRLILWLYLRPEAGRIALASWLYNRIHTLEGWAKLIQPGWKEPNAYFYEVTHPDFGDRTWDMDYGAPMLRRAMLAVAASVGVLALLIIGLPLLVPVALDMAQQGLQWARTYASGWIR